MWSVNASSIPYDGVIALFHLIYPCTRGPSLMEKLEKIFHTIQQQYNALSFSLSLYLCARKHIQKMCFVLFNSFRGKIYSCQSNARRYIQFMNLPEFTYTNTYTHIHTEPNTIYVLMLVVHSFDCLVPIMSD